MTKVLLLTGTCGSGKTTVAALLARSAGWIHISEDDIWHRFFGKDRGRFLSEDHRRKRKQVHDMVFKQLRLGLRSGRNVVLDATVHESPPEALENYWLSFESEGIDWDIRVLHPRLEVAIARDAGRDCWSVGDTGVKELREKFDKGVLSPDHYIDNSDETAEQTMRRLLASTGV